MSPTISMISYLNDSWASYTKMFHYG